MPSKPIPVFLGSAGAATGEERRKVEEALQSLSPKIELVTDLDRAKVYIGIFSGSDDAPANQEYERAKKKGIRCFRYLKGAAQREGDAFNDLDAMIIATKANLRSLMDEKSGFGTFLAQVRAFAGSISGRVLIVAGIALLGYIFVNRQAEKDGEIASAPPPSSATPLTAGTPDASPTAVSMPSLTASPSPSPSATKTPAGSTPRPTPTPKPAVTPRPTETPRPTPLPPPSLSISPRAIRFRAPGNQIVTFTNDRSNQILVSGITMEGNTAQFRVASDGCRNRKLNQGEKCDVTINYSRPPGVTTPPAAQLVITYGYDPSRMTTTRLRMGGEGEETQVEVTVAPTGLTFGTQRVDASSSTQFVTITNNGAERAQVREISVSGEGGILSIGGKRHFTAGQECKRALAPGESCRISVSFTPRTGGSHQAKLRIQVRPEGSSSAGQRTIVSLSGTATQ